MGVIPVFFLLPVDLALFRRYSSIPNVLHRPTMEFEANTAARHSLHHWAIQYYSLKWIIAVLSPFMPVYRRLLLYEQRAVHRVGGRGASTNAANTIEVDICRKHSRRK